MNWGQFKFCYLCLPDTVLAALSLRPGVVGSNTIFLQKKQHTTIEIFLLTVFISGIGDEWGPAVLNTSNEFHFVRHAKGFFVGSYHQTNFIGGTTDVRPPANVAQSIAFSSYIATDSGLEKYM